MMPSALVRWLLIAYLPPYIYKATYFTWGFYTPSFSRLESHDSLGPSY